MGSRGRRAAYCALIAAVAAALAVAWRSCGAKRGAVSRHTVASGSSRSHTTTTRTGRETRPRQKPPSGGLRLEGQVIDEADQPVAGATVRFYNFDQQTLTADDGSFVFEHLGADAYEVIAERGEDTYCEMVRTTLSETSEPVILRLHPGATATVHVVDANGGKPIVGAHVGDRITDDNGNVQVRGLRPGGSNIAIIGVDADGFEHTRAKITNLDLANPADNVVTVQMQRGVVVSGTVVGPNGQPVGDATVYAVGSTQPEAESDATGAWSITLVPGPRQFHASSTDFVDAPPIAIDVDAARSGMVLRLQAPPVEVQPTLVITVVDETGKPVPGAELEIEGLAKGWGEPTDARGRFTALLHAGLKQVAVSARKGIRASKTEDVVIAGLHADARIVIAPSTIAGIVVDTHGHPAPGVRVFLRSHSEGNTLSDAKGHFEIGGLEPGDYALFVAHTEEQFSRAVQGVDASTGDHDVKLVVTDVGNVTGRVVLDGKPVTYFGAYVYEADQILDNPMIVRSAEGRFTLKGMVAGSWTIVLAGPSFGRKLIENVRVPEDGDVDLGVIAVDRGRAVRGRVSDASGAGIAGAEVTIHEAYVERDPLRRAAEGTGIATTDAAGAFRITGLAPPLYPTTRRIVASHAARGVSIERVLAEDTTEVNLVIMKSGGIDGRLEGYETGVFASRLDDPSFTYVATHDGERFRFDNLPPGQYHVRPNTVTAAFAAVTVVSGQRAKVQLVVPPERIEVQVTAAAPCTTITLATEDGVDAITDVNCGTAFEQVAPGTYRACVDGKRCAQIKVLPAPAKQTFAVR